MKSVATQHNVPRIPPPPPHLTPATQSVQIGRSLDTSVPCLHCETDCPAKRSSLTMPPSLSKRQKIGICLALSTMRPSQRRKRKTWVKNWLMKRYELSHINVMRHLEPADFKNLLRMDVECFEELLNMATPLIQKQDTVMRESISPKERLTVTLRFLATGQSYEDLKFGALISPQLMSKMIPETCSAIYKSLKHYIRMPATQTEWKDNAKMFEDKWNFSHCVGTIDGKHIAIDKPQGSGSSFYNYKGFFSIVLFGVVNANYEFMYVHTGINGSISDGGVIRHTSFYNKLMRDELNLPQSCAIQGTNISVPYTFLGDSFGINRHIMMPYPSKKITHKKRIFNYRLSRARRVVENAFGVLAARFKIFRQRISVHVDNVDHIVLACCALHNYLRIKSRSYITKTCVDTENIDDSTFRLGDWRAATPALVSLAQISDKEPNDEGNNVRNKFTTYFNGQGSVPFQEDMLRVVPST